MATAALLAPGLQGPIPQDPGSGSIGPPGAAAADTLIGRPAAFRLSTGTVTTSGSTLLASALPTKGQGSPKRSPVPPPAGTPPVLLRGSAPWSDARVAELIGQGTIQADWLPDIRATALTQLQIQNAQKREMLRFSNAIANTGSGNWQVRRGTPLTDPAQIAYAVSLGLDPGELAITGQELLSSDGSVAVSIRDAALSEYHPAHRHFHIGETAEFGIEHYNESTRTWDLITGLEVVKTTFCLIDVSRIEKVPDSDPDHYDTVTSPSNVKVYNDCYADVQGVQAGWMDRYHHSLPGQEVDVTDLPAGTYRIVSTVNPAGWFLESDYRNNVGWTAFALSRDSNGNGHLREIPGATGGVWFDSSSNGMG
ncbi:MAG: lysyl oxidase family protein [Cyanobium sp.]